MKIYHLKEFNEFMNQSIDSVENMRSWFVKETNNDTLIDYYSVKSKVNLERLKKPLIDSFIKNCLDNYYDYTNSICIYKLDNILVLDSWKSRRNFNYVEEKLKEIKLKIFI
jgi:hypothetical protein